MPTRVYVDTSAVAKLFIAEQETPDLRQWLADLSNPHLVSSALLAVELLRVLRLVNPATISSRGAAPTHARLSPWSRFKPDS